MPKPKFTPLEERVLTVSLAGESREDVDEKIVDPSAGYTENMIFNKHGSVQKCQGYAEETVNWDRASHEASLDTIFRVDDSSKPNRLIASGFYEDSTPVSGTTESQGPDDGDHFFAMSQKLATAKMHAIDEYCAATQRVLASVGKGESKRAFFLVEIGGYIIVSWILDLGAGSNDRLDYLVIHEDTGEVVQVQTTLGAYDCIEQYRIVTNGTDTAYVVAMVEDAGVADKLAWGKIEVNTTTGAVTDTNLTDKISFNSDPANSMYLDAIFLNHPTYGDGTVTIQHDKTGATGANTITLRFFDDAGTQDIGPITKTVGAATDLQGCVSIHHITNYDTSTSYLVWHAVDDTNDDIYMGVVNIDNTFTDSLAGTSVYNGSTAITLLTASADYAVAYDADDPDKCSSMAFWEEATANDNRQVRMRQWRIDTGATSGSIMDAIIESEVISRAFTYRGQCYCWIRRLDDSYPRLFLIRGENPACMALACVDIALAKAVSKSVGLYAGPTPVVFTDTQKMLFCADTDPGDLSSIDTAQGTITELEMGTSNHVAPMIGDARAVGTGSFCAWWDGQNFVEYGFASPPIITSVVKGGAGSIADGDYQFVAVAEWFDAEGNLFRSAPSAPVAFTMAGGPAAATVRVACPIFPSWLRSSEGSGLSSLARVSVFRTTLAGAWHECHSFECQMTVNSFDTADSDTTIESNRYLYSSTEVEASFPFPGKLSLAGSRLWNIPGQDPKTLYYSKELRKGQAPEFTSTHYVSFTDAVLGVASMAGFIIVFLSDRVYRLSGEGLDDRGEGGFYLPELISYHGLTSSNLLLTTPIGVVYHSAEGIMLYTGGALQNISERFEDTVSTAGTPTRIVCQEEDQWIRFFCPSGELIYDWSHQRWTYLDSDAFDDIDLLDDGVLYAWDNSNDVPLFNLDSGYQRDGADYSFTKETGWIKVGNLTGFVRIWWIQILGEHISGAQTLKVTIYHDYSSTVVETHNLAIGAGGVSPYLARIKPGKQKCTAIKIKLEDTSQDAYTACRLNAVELVYGYKGPKARRNTL